MLRFMHAAAVVLTSLVAVGAAHAATSATVVIQAGVPQHQRGLHGWVPVQYGPPPAPRYEAAPPPRRGMVWAEGHWVRRGHRDAWVPGQWIQARPGYFYRQPHWDQRGDRWNMQRGGWDRDRDGVPNRQDRRPDNPYRH
ncbi:MULTISPECIES: hypothetical protein [unclassified Acidovorax]|uniref:hypothetical protein n=1 Tax=unclassified Acidovorax TaxID=2684926 RepID=UPI002882F907|nr:MULTISPECIES: hypothetical protein [unclassified Acidovorax]